jgi:hypothetical protein
MAEDAYLLARTGQTGVATGYCSCSLCPAEFISDRPNPDEMAISFYIHVAHSHADYNARIESVTESAARVVAEAIRRLEEETALLQVAVPEQADEVEVPAKKTLPQWLERLRARVADLFKERD